MIFSFRLHRRQAEGDILAPPTLEETLADQQEIGIGTTNEEHLRGKSRPGASTVRPGSVVAGRKRFVCIDRPLNLLIERVWVEQDTPGMVTLIGAHVSGERRVGGRAGVDIGCRVLSEQIQLVASKLEACSIVCGRYKGDGFAVDGRRLGVLAHQRWIRAGQDLDDRAVRVRSVLELVDKVGLVNHSLELVLATCLAEGALGLIVKCHDLVFEAVDSVFGGASELILDVGHKEGHATGLIVDVGLDLRTDGPFAIHDLVEEVLLGDEKIQPRVEIVAETTEGCTDRLALGIIKSGRSVRDVYVRACDRVRNVLHRIAPSDSLGDGVIGTRGTGVQEIVVRNYGVVDVPQFVYEERRGIVRAAISLDRSRDGGA